MDAPERVWLQQPLDSLDPRVQEILNGLFECEYGTVRDTDEYSDGALTDDGKYLRAWLDNQPVAPLVPDDVREAIEMAFEALFNQQCDSRDHGCMDFYHDAYKAWSDWLGSPPAAPMTDEHSKLPPGSREALVAGCLCPVIDNRYGCGVYTNKAGGIQYWINEDCPIHGKQSDDEQETE